LPKIDLAALPRVNTTGYPPEHAGVVRDRWYSRLGPTSGLTEFGVSHVILKPGAWSGQRHWHEGEDEFVVMLTGHAVLVDDNARTPMGPGDCAAFPKGDGNGHCLINESDADCIFVAVGRPATSDCHYPDIDLHLDASTMRYTHKDGRSF
jgi:uncharacterized cupin superfamily protein